MITHPYKEKNSILPVTIQFKIFLLYSEKTYYCEIGV